MNISPNNNNLSGLQAASFLYEKTAHKVVNASTSSPLSVSGHESNLAECMVYFVKSIHLYSANLTLIKVQERLLGNLIDVMG